MTKTKRKSPLEDVPTSKDDTMRWVRPDDIILGQAREFYKVQTRRNDIRTLVKVDTDVDLPDELGGDRGYAISDKKTLPPGIWTVFETVKLKDDFKRLKLTVGDFIGIEFRELDGRMKRFAVKVVRSSDSGEYHEPLLVGAKDLPGPGSNDEEVTLSVV